MADNRPTSYTEQATTIIRDLIWSGEYVPGEALKEIELADKIGISRSPVRMALSTLASEGLVRFVPHKGASVASFTTDEVRELYEVREAVEVKSVELVTERAPDGDIEQLRGLLDETRSQLGGERASYPTGLDFHLAIVEITGNSQLLAIARNLKSQTQLIRTRSASEPGRAAHALDEHLEIVELIGGRDPAAATRAMRLHLRHSLETILSVLAREGVADG